MNDLYLIGNGFSKFNEKIGNRINLKALSRAILVFAIMLLFCFSTFGHSGRTDANGGHFNRKTGEYHIHNNGRSNDGNGLVVLGIILVVIVSGAIIKGAGDNK